LPIDRQGEWVEAEVLTELATIVAPETVLRWHRRSTAQNYDGSRHWRPAAYGLNLKTQRRFIEAPEVKPTWAQLTAAIGLRSLTGIVNGERHFWRIQVFNLNSEVEDPVDKLFSNGS
jgi:hypothetical protein